MEPGSIRVPYRHLKEEELELVTINGSEDQIDPSPGSTPPKPDQRSPSKSTSLKTLIFTCMVAAGVQFGWALQLSLLTPYIQTLGIGHAFSSFIWLCGPITGLVVQPCVGIWSDKCRSRYGRRRPFIFLGSLMICIAVIIIGFSADIGYLLGDTKEHCSTYRGTRTRAAIIFIIGFWMLDLANNTVQGPARALLADLSGPDQRHLANAIFCSWMAAGNILGYSSGASGNWHRWFPFLTTKACCEACGNLKAAFLVAVVFLIFCTIVTLYSAKEIPLHGTASSTSFDSAPLLNSRHSISNDGNGKLDENCLSEASKWTSTISGNSVPLEAKMDEKEAFLDGPGAVLINFLTSLRRLPSTMHPVLIVMALSWLSWFPFFLFDTDWMGREVYHGDPKGHPSEVKAYDKGVREGAFGLLLNSVVLGISSLLIEPMCKRLGAKLVWVMSNFIVFICMLATAVISLLSIREYSNRIEHILGDNSKVKAAALFVFALLGFPLAITFSVPFSITAVLTADTGGGQGLATGVLNLAIVIPQMIVALGAGPWDALFGGGNVPAFVLASLAALVAAVIAARKLPRLSNNAPAAFHGFG
ncbi:sucrose transport protein SUT4 isoform X2 [Nymphaea colorata]|uniref:sucrose transport protein SUT4 isoform X2 n=1 Tax=Nymphaea colorata TaxID=210225 RepID=UPI00129E25D1|nr:sucrose transport protein SUT4 isoform X2 [Nymphaea colorata]